MHTSKVDILQDVNKTLDNLNYKPMSSITFNKIWNIEYKHATLSKTSELSKCSIYSRIKAQLESTKDEDIIMQLKEDLRVHMKQQQSCRNVYYTWRKFLEMQRDKYLCIMCEILDRYDNTWTRAWNVWSFLIKWYVDLISQCHNRIVNIVFTKSKKNRSTWPQRLMQ